MGLEKPLISDFYMISKKISSDFQIDFSLSVRDFRSCRTPRSKVTCRQAQVLQLCSSSGLFEVATIMECCDRPYCCYTSSAGSAQVTPCYTGLYCGSGLIGQEASIEACCRMANTFSYIPTASSDTCSTCYGI